MDLFAPQSFLKKKTPPVVKASLPVKRDSTSIKVQGFWSGGHRMRPVALNMDLPAADRGHSQRMRRIF